MVQPTSVSSAPWGVFSHLRIMRNIHTLVWHCSATPEGRYFDVRDIRRWHVQGNGWRDTGYHKVVLLDGTVQEGRPESQTGAHVLGHNTGTLGYCYIGGVAADGRTPKDTRTPAQKATMLRLTQQAILKYALRRVSGHNEYAAKACPSFDVRKDELGNIWQFKNGVWRP